MPSWLSPARAPLVWAAFSGAAYAACFPPVQLRLLAWVALVPFFAAATSAGITRGAACGLVWSLVFVPAVGWPLPGMVTSYFGGSALAGWIALAAVTLAFCGVWSSALGAWLGWLARRDRLTPLVAALGWSAFEVLRSHVPFPAPWAISAATQTPGSAILQIADLAGPWGPGFLIGAVNACVAAMLPGVPAVPSPAAVSVREPPRRAGSLGLRGRRPLLSVGATGLLLGASLVYGRVQLGRDFGTARRTEVAIVQHGLARDFAFSPDSAAFGLDRLLDLTAAAEIGPETLVVWPENAVSFYLQEASPQRARVLEAVRRGGVDLVLGGPSWEPGEITTRYFNSVFLLRDGRIAGRTDKRWLVPAAEGPAPFTGGFVGDHPFTPGGPPRPLRSRHGLIGALVCFEAARPDLVRDVARDVDLLVNLSNDAWFGYEAPALHHLELAALRAIETRRWLVRATTTGISALVDPHGRIVARTRYGEATVLRGEVVASRERTAFSSDPSTAPVLILALALAWSWVALVWPHSGPQRRRPGT